MFVVTRYTTKTRLRVNMCRYSIRDSQKVEFKYSKLHLSRMRFLFFKKNRDLIERSLKINGSHLWLRSTKIMKIVRGVPAGSPPVTGPTSICNAITIYSLLYSVYLVKLFFSPFFPISFRIFSTSVSGDLTSAFGSHAGSLLDVSSASINFSAFFGLSIMMFVKILDVVSIQTRI